MSPLVIHLLQELSVHYHDSELHDWEAHIGIPDTVAHQAVPHINTNSNHSNDGQQDDSMVEELYELDTMLQQTRWDSLQSYSPLSLDSLSAEPASNGTDMLSSTSHNDSIIGMSHTSIPRVPRTRQRTHVTVQRRSLQNALVETKWANSALTSSPVGSTHSLNMACLQPQQPQQMSDDVVNYDPVTQQHQQHQRQQQPQACLQAGLQHSLQQSNHHLHVDEVKAAVSGAGKQQQHSRIQQQTSSQQKAARRQLTIVTFLISTAPSWLDVQHIMTNHADIINPYHICAALTRLAQLHRTQARGCSRQHSDQQQADSGGQLDDQVAWGEFVDELVVAADKQWVLFDQTHVTAFLWAVAKMDQLIPHSLQQKALPSVLVMMTAQSQPASAKLAGSMHGASATEQPAGQFAALSNHPYIKQPVLLSIKEQRTTAEQLQRLVTCMWALARLQAAPTQDWCNTCLDTLTPALPTTKPQSLVMLLWALAKFQLPLRQPDADALVSTSYNLLPHCNPHALSVSAWSFTKLGIMPADDWWSLWLTCTHTQLPSANCHDVSISLWSLAASKHSPPDSWMSDVMTRAAQVVCEGNRSELPCLLWSTAQLQYRPSDEALSVFLVETARQVVDYSPQGIVVVLLAVGRLSVTPSAKWQNTFVAASYDLLPFFTPREASALLVGLARQQYIPREGWLHSWWYETAAMLPSFSAQQLANSLLAAVQLGQAPPKVWLNRWLRRSRGCLAQGEFTGRGLSMVLHAFACLEHGPGHEWMELLWLATGNEDMLSSFDHFSCERILWGLAKLRILPPADWFAAYASHTQLQLPSSNAHYVSNIIWGMAVLKLQPGQGWWDAWAQHLEQLVAGNMIDEQCLARALWALNVLQPGMSHRFKASTSNEHALTSDCRISLV